MVIFVKPNGATVVENDVIGLGSFVGKIAVVSPTRTGAYVTLHVAPAHGEYLKPMYCAPMISTDVEDLGIYLCDMTRNISAVAGRVRYQVSFVYEDGREEFTPEGSFTVSQGVVSIPPDDPSESMYNAIRSALIANINNYTEIVEKLGMVWESKKLVEENLEKINASRDAAAASAAEAEEIKDQTRDVVEQSLSGAKESGMFDGVSVTHEWDGSVLRVTSASGTSESDLRGPEGKQGEMGKGFEISKTYESVSAMNAGFATDDVPLYGFVLIDTGNVEDPDNARLYVKQKYGYKYLIDLSGSQGIKGERGYSAFELAVQQGFVGGVDEWLASLKKPAEDAAKNVVAIANDASENALKQAKESGEFDGADGYTPQKGVDYFDGKDGQDGYTPIKGVDYFDGRDGTNGKDGVDGYTPQKGVDYFTETDKNIIISQVYDLIKNGGVVGFVDENNNIVLEGNIEKDNYLIAYKGKDGSIVSIGNLVLNEQEDPEPEDPKPIEVINQIPISTDASGNPFNGVQGWKTGYRLSLSSGGESATDGYECTGFISAKIGDVLRVKDIDLTSENSTNIVFYDSSKTPIKCNGTTHGTSLASFFATSDGNGVNKGTIENTAILTFTTDVAYIRIGSQSITNDSILTVNQEIV